ncbi:MAG: hypothetical protein ABFE01_02605, partial [Phycisphaerales bacterium]
MSEAAPIRTDHCPASMLHCVGCGRDLVPRTETLAFDGTYTSEGDVYFCAGGRDVICEACDYHSRHASSAPARPSSSS